MDRFKDPDEEIEQQEVDEIEVFKQQRDQELELYYEERREREDGQKDTGIPGGSSEARKGDCQQD